jgi:hypothetical protein
MKSCGSYSVTRQGKTWSGEALERHSCFDSEKKGRRKEGMEGLF